MTKSPEMPDSQEDIGLKLMVKSADDITMLSAFLQDGLVAHHDIHYDKGRKEVLLVVDRYRWEASANRDERVLMGLKIGKVAQLLQKKMAASHADNGTSLFYNLLQVSYEQGQDGAKALQFTFSAGAAMRLIVDDLALSAGDIAPPRPAIAKPSHDDESS